jgi:hypothetical protein
VRGVSKDGRIGASWFETREDALITMRRSLPARSRPLYPDEAAPRLRERAKAWIKGRAQTGETSCNFGLCSFLHCLP